MTFVSKGHKYPNEMLATSISLALHQMQSQLDYDKATLSHKNGSLICQSDRMSLYD